MIRESFGGQSRFITVKGTGQHYVEFPGPGEKVVLLHGFASSAHTWKEVARRLQVQGCHVYALDLVGFGWSDKPENAPYDALFLMEGVAAWMEAMGLGPALVAGNSLGGGVAALLALLHPEKVRGLVLINALVPYDIPYPWILKLARLPLAESLARFVVSRNMVRTILEQVFYDPGLVTPEKVEAYFVPLKSTGALRAQVRAARSLEPRPFLRYMEKAGNIQAPCLVIWGAEDRWIPLPFGLRLAQEGKPGDELAVIPGCGHMPQEEKPDETARLMEKFLTERFGEGRDGGVETKWRRCG